MATQYKRSNPYSRYCALADAAIAWHSLPAEQQSLVVIDDHGMPYLAGVPELTERAEAILEAVYAGEIEGQVYYDCAYRRPQEMELLRDSVTAWIAETTRRVAAPPPVERATLPPPVPEQLLTKKDLVVMLRVSLSTLNRMQSTDQIPEPIKIGGVAKWQISVINAWLAERAGTKPAPSKTATPVEEDI